MRDTRQAETLRRVLESFAVDLHVSLPGKVRSYDAATQTAEIEIQVRRVIPAAEDTDEDTVEAYPILPSVPVLWPRVQGAGFLHMKLAAGATVLVLFSEADLGQWRATGEVSDPGLSTRHGLSGGVVLPGLHWRGNPNEDAAGSEAEVMLGVEGGTAIEVFESQINAGGSDTLAKGAETDAQLSAIAADLETIRLAVNAIATGAIPSITITTTRPANPIETSTLRGA